MQHHRRGRSAARRLGGPAIAMIVGLEACGGDDAGDSNLAADDNAVTGSDEPDGGADVAGDGDASEMPYGDPCTLGPPSTVAATVGGDVTGTLANADDGLPGATCLYTVAAGGTLALSVSGIAASFYDSHKSQAEAAGGASPVAGVGDDAFIFSRSEITARSGDAMIQLQVLTSSTTAETGGVEIVRAVVEAIGR